MSDHGIPARLDTLRRSAPVVLALIVGVTVTAVLYEGARRLERRGVEVRMHQEGADRISAFRRGLEAEIDVLHAIRAFFQETPDVDPGRFREFVQPLMGTSRGERASSWVARVADPHRERFERSSRSGSGRNFTIWERGDSPTRVPARGRSEYFPVVLLEPEAGNEAAIGFDVASERTRREALERARDTGSLTSTGPITLVQETGLQRSVLLMLPRYAPGAPTATLDQRREHFVGLFTGVIRIGDLLEHALTIIGPAGVDLIILDETDAGAPVPLAVHASRTRSETPPTLVQDVLETPVRHETAFSVGGRHWRAVGVAAPALARTQSTSTAYVLLAAGLLLTALSALYLHVKSGHEVTLRQLNRELRQRAQSQKLMMDELDHRVRNNLSSVLALAKRTLAGSASLTDYHHALCERIHALARSHQVLASGEPGVIDLGETVLAALGPFADPGRGQVALSGDQVGIPSRLATPLGLALHELATNAAKHGALSTPDGRVAVKWTVADGTGIDLTWVERGGPPVDGPGRSGCGLGLITGLVEHEIGGRVDVQFSPSGVVCSLTLPARA